MPITQEELGRRLRVAREACRMTQDDVGRQLELSRSTIAQIELGKRTVSGLELGKLAYLFGRDMRGFVEDRFEEEDALLALFRSHPEISDQDDIVAALRLCVTLGRELTNLERLLAIDRDIGTIAAYPLAQPKTKWEAIQQGERIAEEERRRLGLGSVALPCVAELLETQGVRTAQVSLPDDVSGLTLVEEDIGFFVVANREHHVLRRRFSYAHEYGHVLMDRGRRGAVSRSRDRDDQLEMRANAFAASLLMPAAGVRQFIHALGKGRPSRFQAEVFDESDALRVEGRSRPGSQDIQIYDVVLMAQHFGASRLAALYRLRNLRLITEKQLDALKSREDAGAGQEMARMLDLPEQDHRAARNEFRRRFLGLALEAYRREEITHSKLLELAAMVEVARREVESALRDLGIEDDSGADVILPEV
ncbi:MAG: ImmA/IrrE family metallo-endopeptidase [Deltaproteobacteria bacterium]|nr:ImmA/IrrE family metallo-endopeptidase [Deltaproteobacteria bacterium]